MRQARRRFPLSLPLRATAVAAVALGLLTAGPLSAASPATAAEPAVTTLAGAFDNTGISADTAAASADFDGDGDSLSATDLADAGWYPGARVTVNGTPYVLPDVAPGRPDNVVADGQTVAVAGRGDALGFLTVATHGPATGHGTIHYRDGGVSHYTLTAADWTPADTETAAVTLAHVNSPAGRQDAPVSLYAVTVPVRHGETVRAVTLPRVRGGSALHVFAVAVRDTTTAPSGGSWTGSWAASMGSAPAVPQSPDWQDQTLRMVVDPHTSGGTARLHFSNTFAPAPVRFGHATVAVQSAGADAAAPPVTLTFGGSRQATIPAGGEVYSDPVPLPVTAGHNLLVSLYLPDAVTRAPIHSYALTTSYTSGRLAGDHTADTSGTALTGTFSFWTYLSGVDVVARHGAGTVVALGDSQTDGAHSTANADLRWPDDYAGILNARRHAPGVVNAGISGNRLLIDQASSYGPSALNRLDRDVFSEPGVRTVVLYEGINDIALDDATPAALEDGIRGIAAQAQARGLRLVVTTIPAFGGYSAYTAAREAVREEVNTYIRTTRDFRYYTDFDLVTRDPSDPTRLRDGYYDPADHLHFNDTGCEVLAQTLADDVVRHR
jgi:lysophospholipase L1-like esterase